MWIAAGQSVIGTSHIRDNLHCQDACRIVEVPCHNGNVLACVCADGAGSMQHAAVGARLACEDLIELCTELLPAETQLDTFSAHQAREWCAFLQQSLRIHAMDRNVELEEFACTLLVALIGPKESCFFQIGDGGIVVQDQQTYRLIFKPQHGEFAESTRFLTDPDISWFLRFKRINSRIDSIGLFTDGLESLLLTYPQFEVHQPFFEKVFDAVHHAADPSDLQIQIQSLLQSPQINQRTSDDKTLILASRNSQTLRQPRHVNASVR